MESGGKETSEKIADQLLGPKTYEILRTDDATPITILNKWHRAGGETYCTDFRVGEGKDALHLIAKACIRLFAVLTVKDWMEKREYLQERGINFPRLHAVDRAVIVEEFIPIEFKSALKNADDDEKIMLKDRFMETYSILCRSGFSPIRLHDLRTRGGDCVVIDLGSDLGPRGVNSQSESLIIESANREFKELCRT